MFSLPVNSIFIFGKKKEGERKLNKNFVSTRSNLRSFEWELVKLLNYKIFSEIVCNTDFDGFIYLKKNFFMYPTIAKMACFEICKHAKCTNLDSKVISSSICKLFGIQIYIHTGHCFLKRNNLISNYILLIIYYSLFYLQVIYNTHTPPFWDLN